MGSRNTMRPLTLAALGLALLAGTGLAQAQSAASAAPAASAPRTIKDFSFFLTSRGLGKGADLGGLAGADAHCQQLAAAVGNPHKVWHAYLSTQAREGQPAVNARERIGDGPWTNIRGQVVARDLAHLHGDSVELARVGNNLSRATVFNELNEQPKGFGERPNEHDILTGSQPDGRAFADAADHTCSNYSSSAEGGSVQLGHFDRAGGGNVSWNTAHPSRGCSQDKLVATGGAGLFYCFAVQ